MKKFTSYFLPLFMVLLGLSMLLAGCASGGSDTAGSTSDPILNIRLKVSDAGEIDTTGSGYYAILFNSTFEPIEVTNFETYTDFIRFDGSNFNWYHRQGNVPTPGYTWVNVGNINSCASVSGEDNTIIIRLNLNDSESFFNQYIEANRFTVHVLTTDADNSLLGRALDTLGQGSDFTNNALYTVYFDKLTGILDPEPTGYPADPLEDYDVKPDMPAFPYDDYDIESFSVDME